MKLFQRYSTAKPIYQMPARYSSYLHPNQFVQVVHTESQQVYGWCEVKDLKASLALTGSDVKDFHLKPLDAQGNPAPIQNVLQLQPYRFLVFDREIDLNLAFQLLVAVLTFALFLIHLRGNFSRYFIQVISSEHRLNLKHKHPPDFEGDGQPPSDERGSQLRS